VHGATLAQLTGSGGGTTPPLPPPSSGPPGGPVASLLHHEAGDLFFTNAEGREVWLAGSHTWTNVQDRADAGAFGWGAFVALQEAIGANLVRLWTTDNPHGHHGEMSPLPHVEVSPGVVDLTRLDQAYYDRLRARVEDLNEAGIYADVMMFNGLSYEQGWENNPFKGGNNVNGVDASHEAVVTGSHPAVLAAMEAHVRKVVDTLRDLPNVIYEVGNEFDQASMGLQQHLVEVIRRADGGAHPVGITAPNWWTGDRGTIAGNLAGSNADWVSPDGSGGYMTGDPPAASGRKVSIVDTDHLWGHGGMSVSTPWEMFTRGHGGYMQMDTLTGTGIPGVSGTFRVDDGGAGERGGREGIRQTMLVSRMIDLNGMREAGRLSSTGFAIADPADGEFVVYAPRGGSFTLDLSGARGQLQVFWVDVDSGAVARADAVAAGAAHTFHSPYGHAALVLTDRPLI
jgi:hypothetical protein